jgi:uncharacterized repeat protein (TIGR02543 family)
MEKKTMKSTLATLSLLLFAGTLVVADETISLGTVNLQANTAGQTFNVPVTGTDQAAGMDLYLQVNGGISGPKITTVTLADAGTLWGATADQMELGGSDDRTVFYGVITASGTVLADGVAAIVTVDTTGISGGNYPLTLTVLGEPSDILDEFGDPLALTLVDGMLVVPYTITASAGAGGSIAPSGTLSINPGDDQEYTITANAGYQIADVLVDGSSIGAVSSHTFTDVDDDHTIVASFSAVPLTVVKSADPVSVPEGSTAQVGIKLSAQPAGDIVLEVAKASGDADLTLSGESSLTFTQANWDTEQYVTLAAAEDNSDTANGTATFDIAKTSGINSVTATTVTANEVDDDFTLTVNAGTGGTTTPSGAVIVDSNNALPYAVEATPSAGYAFTDWTDVSTVLTDADSASTTVKVGTTADCAITANFAAVTLTVVKSADPVSVPEGSTAQVGIKLSAQPAGDIVLEVAKASGDADLTLSGESSLTFTQANWDTEQYVTLAAAEDNSDTANGTATFDIAKTSGINSVTATTVTANEADDDFTLTVNAGTGGTTTPSGAVIVDSNDDLPKAVIVTHIDMGYRFVNWTDDSNVLANANAPLTTVKAGTTADCTVTANFAVNTVMAAQMFYNNSAWDGSNAAANVDDDAAIATDKAALLPGGTATFANYTSFNKGINGIMFDIYTGGTAALTDFTFKVGNDNSPGAWADAPAPTTVATRPIGVGLKRITVIWADNAIEKTWLQVTVKATANTWLTDDEVFYFGNAVGDSGNSALNAIVNASDQLGVRSHPSALGGAAVDNDYDFNRDKTVNASDQLISRSNCTSVLTAVKLIAVP